MLKVAKFGGSSVAGTEQFKKVKAIVDRDPNIKVVVLSAAGKRSSDDHKLTDLLYLCHAHLSYGVPCDDIIHTIEQRLCQIRDELGISFDVGSEMEKLEKSMSKDMSADELVSRGEYLTSRLMADYLGFQFVDAADCVFFSFDGQIDKEKTYGAIAGAYEKYGRIRVMTRGGSDISGALAAAAIDADVYENWTDVSGILMADPRIVKDPQPIEKITYAELRELAFMGASVLHEESVLPVKEKGIALNIRNTNCPEHPGTVIVDKIEGEESHERFLTGIAGRKNFTIITVNKRNMNTSQTLRQALEILDRYPANVEHITLGLDSFALVTATAPLGDGLYSLMGDIEKNCHPDNIQVNDGIALVAAVGRKMTYRPGISGKIFRALGEEKINIRTIAQGADELSIIVGVENKNYEAAVRVLYESFAG